MKRLIIIIGAICIAYCSAGAGQATSSWTVRYSIEPRRVSWTWEGYAPASRTGRGKVDSRSNRGPAASRSLTAGQWYYLSDRVSLLSIPLKTETELKPSSCRVYLEFRSEFGVRKLCEAAAVADSEAQTLLGDLERLMR